LLISAAVLIARRFVAEGDGDGDGDAVGLGETEVITVGLTTFTPLFHTSLVPDLMQVYFNPAETVVDFSLLQVLPALVAAFDEAVRCVRKIVRHIAITR